MSGWGDGGGIEVGGGNKGGIGSERSGVDGGGAGTKDLRRVDKGVWFVAGIEGRPGC